MQNPIYEKIAAAHDVSANEAEVIMSEALSCSGIQISASEFLYTLSQVLLEQDNEK